MVGKVAQKRIYICDMHRQNNRYLILMVSSILVMLVLQVFWLNAVYQDYKRSLKQETGLLLNNTVTELIDSLVWKGMAPVKFADKISAMDSAGSKPRILIRRFDHKTVPDKLIYWDSLPTIPELDSLAIKTIQIISSDLTVQADSLKHLIRPMFQGTDSTKNQQFTFSLNNVPIDSALLVEVFNKRLEENDYPLQAVVRKPVAEPERTRNSGNHLFINTIFIPFGVTYDVFFDTYQTYLWGKMIAPISFAFLALVLILFSFYVLYQNALQQQRLNILKNDIISNITHELKTPVATVSVVLESLENFGADHQEQTRKEYIQIAKQELKRLSVLTERILQDAVMGVKTITKEKLDFDQVVETQLAAFKPILSSKNFVLDYQKAAGDYRLKGDEEQLALMVFNLLDNAIKYSAEAKSIHVQLSQQAGVISLKIKDHGKGIPLKYQKAIFEKFVRVPQQDLHEVKGYGLGLAQVSAAVQAHEGNIHVMSKEGNGSLFTIELPQR
jgi:two-component system, OmpR family, phosphate regulon sensor histidine kinase PhoR